MKVSLFLDTTTPSNSAEDTRRKAIAAEEAGIYGVWVSEHVVLFENYKSSYPFSADGKWIVPIDTGVPDPFIYLTMLAGVTDRLRLGTAIVILPQRNPVQTAKLASDLDVVSSGRMRLGIGVGWSSEEYEALQVPWKDRGRRTDEYLAVMRTLWHDQVSSYSGEFYNLPKSLLYPKSVQKPNVPTYVCSGSGKMSSRQLNRAAEYASGWIGLEMTPKEVEAQVSDLKAALEDHGRRLEDFEVVAAPPGAALASMESPDSGFFQDYIDAGITELLLVIGAENVDESVRQIKTFGSQVVNWFHNK